MARWIQLAVRRLRRSGGFTFTACLMLAVGLGSATTVFSVVHAVLLRPLPYPRSERLVSLSHALQVRGSLHVDQTDASILFQQKLHDENKPRRVAPVRPLARRLSDI